MGKGPAGIGRRVSAKERTRCGSWVCRRMWARELDLGRPATSGLLAGRLLGGCLAGGLFSSGLFPGSFLLRHVNDSSVVRNAVVALHRYAVRISCALGLSAARCGVLEQTTPHPCALLQVCDHNTHRRQCDVFIDITQANTVRDLDIGVRARAAHSQCTGRSWRVRSAIETLLARIIRVRTRRAIGRITTV